MNGKGLRKSDKILDVTVYPGALYHFRDNMPFLKNGAAEWAIAVSFWAAGEDIYYINVSNNRIDIMHEEIAEVSPVYDEESGEYVMPDVSPFTETIETIEIDKSRNVVIVEPLLLQS